MKLLNTYQNVHDADMDRQLLGRKNISTSLISSDGRLIDRLTDFDMNLGDTFSYSLWVSEDNLLGASKFLKRNNLRIKISQFSYAYLVPIFIFVFGWLANTDLNHKAKVLLQDAHLPTQYAGTLASGMLFAYGLHHFSKKWLSAGNYYGKTEIGRAEMAGDAHNLIVGFIMTVIFFVMAYFSI